MSTNKIAGTAFVKYSQANGQSRQLALRGNWTVSIDPDEREGIAGQDGVHGYKEMPRVPFMEGEFSTVRGFSIDELKAIKDATITTETANGNVYLLRNAWTAGAREIDTAEGQCSIRFEGLSGEELVPQE